MELLYQLGALAAAMLFVQAIGVLVRRGIERRCRQREQQELAAAERAIGRVTPGLPRAESVVPLARLPRDGTAVSVPVPPSPAFCRRPPPGETCFALYRLFHRFGFCYDCERRLDRCNCFGLFAPLPELKEESWGSGVSRLQVLIRQEAAAQELVRENLARLETRIAGLDAAFQDRQWK